MTEKRFTVKDDVGMLDVACANIFDNGEFIGTVPLFDAEKFVDLLNTQHEQIQSLEKEIEDLKQENGKFKEPNCHKCGEYSSDSVGDYCMSDDGLLGDAWEMFPMDWDYSKAKDCKEYWE